MSHVSNLNFDYHIVVHKFTYWVTITKTRFKKQFIKLMNVKASSTIKHLINDELLFVKSHF